MAAAGSFRFTGIVAALEVISTDVLKQLETWVGAMPEATRLCTQTASATLGWAPKIRGNSRQVRAAHPP